MERMARRRSIRSRNSIRETEQAFFIKLNKLHKKFSYFVYSRQILVGLAPEFPIFHSMSLHKHTVIGSFTVHPGVTPPECRLRAPTKITASIGNPEDGGCRGLQGMDLQRLFWLES
jgi:hypothetical protein